MRTRLVFIAAAFAAAMPLPAQSSGSGTYTPPGPQERQDLRDPYREAYDTGRRTLKRDVTCKTCLFPEGVKDRETAFQVIERLQAGEISLSEEKTSALVYYLDRRFKLRSDN